MTGALSGSRDIRAAQTSDSSMLTLLRVLVGAGRESIEGSL